MSLILAAGFAVISGLLIVTAPVAEAVTGRRVCLYAQDITGDNVRTNVRIKGSSNAYTTPRVRRAVGVNYTANKSCPQITSQSSLDRFSNTFQGAPLSQVTAVRCEDWLGTIRASGGYYDAYGDYSHFNVKPGQHPADVCTVMRKDIFFEFNVIIESLDDMEPAVNDFTVWGYSMMTIQDMT